MKELNYNILKKYNEKYKLYSKEIETQNKIKNFIHLCVEDLNSIYKSEKSGIIKIQKEIKSENNKKGNISQLKEIERKLFIFSYIYDNCLNNGEIKELKSQYSMFLPKNK